jgi:DNA-binding transcriptional ArsR family regulator
MTASDLQQAKPAVGENPTEAFALLSNETRVDVLRALADTEEALRFAQLRRRVGLRDGGVFTYHLEKLRGTFVEKRGDRYRLTTEGERVATLL